MAKASDVIKIALAEVGYKEKALYRVKGLSDKERKDAVKKSCARVFQALRIDVNSEFEVLR